MAIEPAPPDAVTTEVNGMTAVPSETSTPLSLGFEPLNR